MHIQELIKELYQWIIYFEFLSFKAQSTVTALELAFPLDDKSFRKCFTQSSL